MSKLLRSPNVVGAFSFGGPRIHSTRRKRNPMLYEQPIRETGSFVSHKVDANIAVHEMEDPVIAECESIDLYELACRELDRQI